MAVKSITSVKSFFEAGDVPTGDQFVDLIDSTYSGEIGAAIVSAAAVSAGVVKIVNASSVSILDSATAGEALLAASTPASARTVLESATAGDTIFQISTEASVRTFIGAATDASASQTAAGLIELATTAEATAGTDATRAITPATLAAAAHLTLDTTVATTSGTEIDFTGISANAKQIIVTYVGVSTDGTANIELKVSDTGTFPTTGYDGRVNRIFTNTVAGSDWPVDAVTLSDADPSAITLSGEITLTLHDSATNTWVVSGISKQASQHYINAGAVPLSGVLDRVRLTTANGTDAFDAGSMNIQVHT